MSVDVFFSKSTLPGIIFAREKLNIPMEAKVHYTQLDTICLSKGIHMETISDLLGFPLEDIESLNPIYKKSYIPKTIPNQCISLPHTVIGKLVSKEADLYDLERFFENGEDCN